MSNVGKIFVFKGNKYQKIPEMKKDSCEGCITDQDSNLCYEASDCDGVILHMYRSWLKNFKNL